MKFTLRGMLWTAGILGAAAALYIFVLRGGDDQPPIIVSDGTVHLKSDFDPHGNGRGEWEKVNSANPLVWAFRHAGGKATGSIDVNVLDGTNDGCDNASELFTNATKVEAQYTGGITLTIVFNSAEQKYRRLQATFTGLAEGNPPLKHGTNEFWLEAGPAGAKLERAVITAGSITTCYLGEYGEVRILQRKE